MWRAVTTVVIVYRTANLRNEAYKFSQVRCKTLQAIKNLYNYKTIHENDKIKIMNTIIYEKLNKCHLLDFQSSPLEIGRGFCPCSTSRPYAWLHKVQMTQVTVSMPGIHCTCFLHIGTLCHEFIHHFISISCILLRKYQKLLQTLPCYVCETRVYLLPPL